MTEYPLWEYALAELSKELAQLTSMICRSPHSILRDLHKLWQDDIPFEPGEGVEEYLQLLEAGKPLPPSPREAGRPKESARSFLARMDALQARFDAQFLKRKDWQVNSTLILLCALRLLSSGVAAQ